MTLILSVLTRDCVYQVSDRRLTSYDPPRRLVDDHTNKAVVLNGDFVFGYTGMSHIGSKPTDDWIADTLAEVQDSYQDIGKALNHLRDSATLAVAKIPWASRYKRHAFQGVGWVQKPGGPLCPAVTTIHNALTPKDFKWQSYANQTFSTHSNWYTLKKNQFVIASAGHSLTDDEKNAIYRHLRKCIRRDKRAVVDGLVRSMRWISRRHEPTSPIGRNLLVICMPRLVAEKIASGSDIVMLAAPPLEDYGTFLYVPEKGGASTFGPHLVLNGGSIKNFEVRYS